MDTSYFKPWTPEILYEVEPELEVIAANALECRQRQYKIKRAAYVRAKETAYKLVGWYTRDPRLRNQGAWDCFFRLVLDHLNI